MNIDNIDRHLAAAGSLAGAAVPPGLFLAWCANLRLLDTAFEVQHEQAVLRVRMRDLPGSEFLVANAGGRLDEDQLSPRGRAFARAHYRDYLRWIDEILDDPYDGTVEWRLYDQAAAWLTARLLAPGDDRGDTAAAQGRKWWTFWRRRPR